MTEPSTNSNAFEITSHESSSDLSSALGHALGSSISTKRLSVDLTTDALPDALSANWSKLTAANLTKSFRSRLLTLASDRLGTSPSEIRGLRPKSLSDFLDFWDDVKEHAVEPEITVSRDGSLVAEWFKSEKERLDIKFADRALLFGLLDKGAILEGAQGIDLVSKILLDHDSKPLKWRA